MPVAQRAVKAVTKTKKSMPKKMERIDLRLRADQKELIERAAHLRGLSVSDFVMQNADEAAIKTIEQNTRLVLSGKDAVAFIEMLENPPAPSARLKKAFQQYRDEVGSRARKAS